MDERAARCVDGLAVEREGRVSRDDEVELLVPLAVRLVVLPDELLAVLDCRPGVDAECPDVERRANGVPARLPGNLVGDELVEVA